jgi:hypothetical protein
MHSVCLTKPLVEASVNDNSTPVPVIVRRRARSVPPSTDSSEDRTAHDPWRPVHARLKQIMADRYADLDIRASCVLLRSMVSWSCRASNLYDSELQARELMCIVERIDTPPNPVITVADVWKAAPKCFRQNEVETVRTLLDDFKEYYRPPSHKAAHTSMAIRHIQRGLNGPEHIDRESIAVTAFELLAESI